MERPNVQQPVEPTAGKAFTIMEFGELISSQGLPIFGSPREHIDRASGEVLLVSSELPREFEGRGGGVAPLVIWGRQF